ncbi:MAG: DNA polymerase I [Alphaproteobacteria bacterium]
MSVLRHLDKKTLFLIDGSGFIFRAYHALPPLSRSDGTPVGAVLGFTNMLVKILSDMNAHYVAVIFDAGRRTFRNDLYDQYKANRRETPEDLIPQFPLIREACTAFGVPIFETVGFEADDIIATYAAQQKDRDVIIVSSDKDLMQLVSDRVKLYDPLKNKLIDKEGVLEKFEVAPDQVVDVQALAGDSSDNIPGVPGIGIKTASALIQEFGTLESLLEKASTIKQQKRRESLIEFADQARLSKKLVTLCGDVPNLLPLDQLKITHMPLERIIPFLDTQGFRSLKKRLMEQASDSGPLDPIPATPSSSHQYSLILNASDLDEWIHNIQQTGLVAVDTETTSLDATTAKLVGISFGLSNGQACYIPVLFNPQESLLEAREARSELTLSFVLEKLKPILENPHIIKVGHNIKYDKLVLKQYGLSIKNYEDTMLLSYLQKGGRHGLDYLTEFHFNHRMASFTEVVGTGKKAVTFDQVPLKQALDYAASDADYTYRLYELLKPGIQRNPLKKLYETIDLPLVDVLVQMEHVGIKVDPKVLQNLTVDLNTRLQSLEKKIHLLAGEEFNIGSPKQLGEILFEKLNLTGGKKGKTGAFLTGSEVLEELAPFHPLPEQVLEWRQLSKLKSTYTTTLIDQINPKTGGVHTSYAMAITSTGRLSSSDPNLQNIPIRTEEGRKIRKAFIAREDHVLVSFDYSQIELRLLAHMAHIDVLQNAFLHNQDIHALTASEVFGVPLEKVSADLRSKAKAINFGIIYGISAFGLAKQLKIDRGEASSYIQAYHAQYPGIKAYMDRTIDFARTHGYVETLWGRRCYVPEINSKNGTLRSFAERQAINAPLQGSNADLIKKAMIECHNLVTAGYQSKLLLQVHDELIFEVPEQEIETLVPKIRQIMESVDVLTVPLVVGVGKGKTWEDAH